MNNKILVAYATGTGSTVGVAEKIGETMAGRGYAVDVVPMNENPDPSAYQAVVLGSAVNGGKWLPAAVEYVSRNQAVLKQRPIALFCVHILNTADDEKSEKNRRYYLDDIRPLTDPVSEAFFAGMGPNPKGLAAPLVRWLLQLTRICPAGDARDWGKISTWAQQVFA